MQCRIRPHHFSSEQSRSKYFTLRAFETALEKRHSFKRLVLSEEQRIENGYPVRGPKGVEIQPNEYQKGRKMFYTTGDTMRTCTRCRQHFRVSWDGTQSIDFNLVCFDGTQSYNFHVHDQMSTLALKMFKSTPPVNMVNSYNSNQLFGLDVEMIFTSKGQAVGRVTLVSHTEAVLLDLIVKQTDEVFDPLTQYSGLTFEDLDNATWTIDAVRRALLQEINSESILVGHGLSSDLKALGIVHDKVIDTSVIYSFHGRRPSLRHLTQNHLGYQIQQSADGHCSVEDAVAAVRLVIHGLNHPDVLDARYQKI